MRDLGLLIGLLALAGMAGYVVSRWPHAQSPTLTRPPVAPLVSTAEPKQEPKPPRISRAPQAAPAEPEPPAPQVQAPPPPPPVRRPFPTAEDIPVGTDRTTLLEKFGQPALKTSAVDRDGLLETYMYVHADRTKATQVLLREAKVVAAHTGSY